MPVSREITELAEGLRALEILGTVSPIDPGSFAQAVGVGLIEAVGLLEAFEAHGFARRVPGGGFFVLTRLALGLVVIPSVVGRLVSHAIEPIIEFGDRMGQVVALSVPRGRELMCCVVSRSSAAAGVSPGLRRLWPDPSLAQGNGEISLALRLDGTPIALLAIHCNLHPIPDQQLSLRRQLEILASRMVRDLQHDPASVPKIDSLRFDPIVELSAMVH